MGEQFLGAAGAETVIAKLPAVDVLVNCRYLRAEAVCGDLRSGLVPFLRGQRHERSQTRAVLSLGDADERLGSYRFHFE
jgi:hypothetical protein